MNIEQIHLKNFRGFKSIDFSLHPRFNLVIGINGTGKTALLEAMRIAIGSLFLDMDKVQDKIHAPHVKPDDVLLDHLEKQYPVEVFAKGTVSNESIEWKREVSTEGGRTKSGEAKSIKKISRQIQNLVRKGDQETVIPLVAYYSTDRFKKEKAETGIEPLGSRLRGYFNSLDDLTNLKFFLNLFRTEEYAALQQGRPSEMIEVVKFSVKKCVPDCEKIYHHIQRDELIITFSNGDEIPFSMLSDGIRTMLGMAMEIAFRCYLLNPHLGIEAATKTEGIILIDEIDLHLHPSWQKSVIGDLQSAFSEIQFVATTHAPLTIGSLRYGSILALKDKQIFSFPSLYGQDANFILLNMETDERISAIKSKLDEYFILIENGKGKSPESISLRKELEELLGKSDPELQRADMMLTFFE